MLPVPLSRKDLGGRGICFKGCSNKINSFVALEEQEIKTVSLFPRVTATMRDLKETPDGFGGWRFFFLLSVRRQKEGEQCH